MSLVAGVLGIIAFFMAMGLRSRVSKLEALLKQGSQPTPAHPSVAAVAPIVSAMMAQPAPQPVVPSGPTANDRLAAWLKEDWLLKLGALLLLIGFGWLASYAFAHNWIGPMGRITLGIVSGVAILLFGWYRIRRFLHQGSIFLTLGSTVILLTVFAAREIYEFFTPVSALGIMFLATAFVALMSVVYRSKGLAVVSLALAAIAPQFLNMAGPDNIMLFSYLLVIILGAIWIVALTGWVEAPLTALVVFMIYSVPRLAMADITELAPLLPFAYVFAAIFLIANITRILKTSRGATRELMPDLFIAIGNGALLIAWIVQAAPEVWQSLLLSAWMVVFVGASFMVFKATGRREPFYAYAAVGVAMLGAATASELSGAGLTIAYTIEAALIALLTMAITRDRAAAERVSWLFVIPIFFSMESLYWRTWGGVTVGTHFFVLLLLAASLMGLGFFFMKSDTRGGADPSGLSKLLTVLGSMYFYVLIWNTLHVAFAARRDIAVGASLVIFTLIGLITYFSGRTQGKGLRYYGGALLVFVVGRLLIVDIWQMDLAGRIVVFFLVGTLLITTAFIGRRFSVRKNPGQP